MATSSLKTIATSTIGGVKVPALAIGTWSWGDTSTWGHKESDLEEIKQAWIACNEVGLTFYDTAEVYGTGESERIIGRLRREADEETRQKLYIASKYLPIPRPQNFFVFTPGIVAACKKSLERLGMDSMDLYQIHGNVGPHSISAMGKELAKCQKLGLCKAVGISNFSRDQTIEMANVLEKEGVKLASNQVEYSLLRQHPENSGLLEECKKRDIALLAYSPLAMGRLTGKYSSSNPVPKGRRFSSGFSWEQLDPLINEMRTLAEKYEVSISAIALNWVISKGAIPLGGARNGKQARENAKATEFRLTEAEVEALGKLGFEGSTSWWQKG